MRRCDRAPFSPSPRPFPLSGTAAAPRIFSPPHLHPRPPPQCFDELETFLNPASKKPRTPPSNKKPAAPNKPRKLKERKRSKLAVPRWCIPAEQLVKLEEVFEKTKSPSFVVREALAEEFGATTRQVRPAAPIAPHAPARDRTNGRCTHARTHTHAHAQRTRGARS